MAGSFSVPNVQVGSDVVKGMETALANKIGNSMGKGNPMSKTLGPSKTPLGWSKGKKTGWAGGSKPPGLAKKMTGSMPSQVPVDVPRGTGTPRIGKPPEFTV